MAKKKRLDREQQGKTAIVHMAPQVHRDLHSRAKAEDKTFSFFLAELVAAAVGRTVEGKRRGKR